MVNLELKRKEIRRLKEKNDFLNRMKRSGKMAGITFAAMSVLASVFPVNGSVSAWGEFQCSESMADYLQELANGAVPVAREHGLFPSVMMAQAILESGYGSSQLSKAPYYNLFGVKGSYNGQSVTMKTSEFVDGQWISVDAVFRVYPSFAESFQDNARVLKTTNFGSGAFYYGAWREYAGTYQEATQWLQGRYATDPEYANHLNRIIEQYGLVQYDEVDVAVSALASQEPVAEVSPAVESVPAVEALPVSESSEPLTYYTVEVGDSVWKISQKFGISLAEFQVWNQLNDTVIHPGQQVVIREGVVEQPALSESVVEEAIAFETPMTEEMPISEAQPTSEILPVPEEKVEVLAAVIPSKENEESIKLKKSLQFHTVVLGDSIWSIAYQYGVSVKKILIDNKMHHQFLFPGQKLIIEGGRKRSASSKRCFAKFGDSWFESFHKPGVLDRLIVEDV